LASKVAAFGGIKKARIGLVGCLRTEGTPQASKE